MSRQLIEVHNSFTSLHLAYDFAWTGSQDIFWEIELSSLAQLFEQLFVFFIVAVTACFFCQLHGHALKLTLFGHTQGHEQLILLFVVHVQYMMQ